MQTEFTTKTKVFEDDIGKMESEIFGLKVSDRVKGSKSFKGTIFEGVPDVAISYFGKNFKVEEGDVVGYLNGNRIMNPDPNKFNEIANVDDALTVMMNGHPDAKSFRLAGSGGPGGGQPFADSTGVVQVTRTEMKNPIRYAQVMKSVDNDISKVQFM